jgi:hypothetical protein
VLLDLPTDEYLLHPNLSISFLKIVLYKTTCFSQNIFTRNFGNWILVFDLKKRKSLRSVLMKVFTVHLTAPKIYCGLAFRQGGHIYPGPAAAGSDRSFGLKNFNIK